MKRLILLLPLFQSCMVADAVIDNTQIYCSEPYKLARSAARSVVTLTTGIAVMDTCDALEALDGEATEEEGD